MTDEKLCTRYLRAAAKLVRTVGLARGARRDYKGAVCMLGALDHCGISITYDVRKSIEAHLVSILPSRPEGEAGYDKYNNSYVGDRVDQPGSHIAWYSNMIAKDANEVAEKLELAAESC